MIIMIIIMVIIKFLYPSKPDIMREVRSDSDSVEHVI